MSINYEGSYKEFNATGDHFSIWCMGLSGPWWTTWKQGSAGRHLGTGFYVGVDLNLKPS